MNEYERGFADGLVGAMRGHGAVTYHEGYDNGLDAYDDRLRAEGWL